MLLYFNYCYYDYDYFYYDYYDYYDYYYNNYNYNYYYHTTTTHPKYKMSKKGEETHQGRLAAAVTSPRDALDGPAGEVLQRMIVLFDHERLWGVVCDTLDACFKPAALFGFALVEGSHALGVNLALANEQGMVRNRRAMMMKCHDEVAKHSTNRDIKIMWPTKTEEERKREGSHGKM